MRRSLGFKGYAIVIIVAAALFGLSRTGVISSDTARKALSVVSPDAARLVGDKLDSWGGTLRGQGKDFQHAKQGLKGIYKKHPEWMTTIYCGLPFTKDWKVNPPEGFSFPSSLEERAYRVEWEHAVPAENFGRHFKEWRDGAPQCGGKNGRECARTNPAFSRMEGDMHNLFPADGAVNAARSNFRYREFGESGHAETPFGTCPMKIMDRAVEPPERARGPVARASLYMAWQYRDDVPHLFSDTQLRLFEAWNRKYPPEEWECRRNTAISRIQGAMNPYIVEGCKER